MTMSKARKLVEQYLAELDSGSAPRWARKTEFTPLPNGKGVRRLITRADGTVEKDQKLTGPRWQFMAARMGTGLSQAQFAALLGVSRRTLEGWEQGRKKPSGAAATLLTIAAKRPDVLREIAAG
jgi:putative transcriptional regulator